MKMKTLEKVGLGLGMLTLGGTSFAAIDTTDIMAAIADSQTAAVAVASAVLVLIVSVKAFKYIRRAL
jgi:hypothetical protein